MAITDSQKLDLLWKKLGYGVTKTDTVDRKSASNESIPSPLLIRGDRIWIESDQIPSVIPQTSSEYVQVHSDYLDNTVKCVMDNTSEPLRTWKSGLPDWIPSEFGTTYQIKVYVDTPEADNPVETGTRLYPDGTGNDEWFFDYASGVLNFIGDSLPSSLVSNKVVYITGARYVGRTGLDNLGNVSGSVGAVSGNIPASQTFTGDDETTNFVLSHTPVSATALDVYVNDVLQRPEEVFSLSGNVLQFSEVPPTGTDIYVKYRYPFATIVDNPERSIENKHLNLTYTSDQYEGDGSQQIFDINPGHTVHDVLVIVDGKIIPPVEYTISGTVLTILNSPDDSSTIDIRYLPV